MPGLGENWDGSDSILIRSGSDSRHLHSTGKHEARRLVAVKSRESASSSSCSDGAATVLAAPARIRRIRIEISVRALFAPFQPDRAIVRQCGRPACLRFPADFWTSKNTNDATASVQLDEPERGYLRTLSPIAVGLIEASRGRPDQPLQPPEVALAKIEQSLGVTFEPKRFNDWPTAASAFQRGEIEMIVAPSPPGTLNYAMHSELQPLDLLIKRAFRQAETQAVARQAASATTHISALRLLPALIGIAAVLFVTLRAFVRLQQEMGRRMETEQRLATQLSFQQTMMEVVPYPLVAKDMQNRYIAVNRAFEEALGVRRGDVLGRTSVEVTAWGDAHSRVLHELTSTTLKTGQRQEVEAEFADNSNHSRCGLSGRARSMRRTGSERASSAR